MTDSTRQIFQKLQAFNLSIRFPVFTKAEANYNVHKSWLLIAVLWQPIALHYLFLSDTFQFIIFTFLSPLVFLILYYYYYYYYNYYNCYYYYY